MAVRFGERFLDSRHDRRAKPALRLHGLSAGFSRCLIVVVCYSVDVSNKKMTSSKKTNGGLARRALLVAT